MEAKQTKITYYEISSGDCPFDGWIASLSPEFQGRIIKRLKRVAQGNLGDWKRLQGYKKLFELIVDDGPGFRIYYAKSDELIILWGGLKKSQMRDIEKAEIFLADYIARKQREKNKRK